MVDGARQLGLTAAALADELLTSMTAAGAAVLRDGALYAAAEHTEVDAAAMPGIWPKDW